MAEIENGAFFNYVNLETLRLTPDDVSKAVEIFEQKFRQRPLAIGLHENGDPWIQEAAEELGIPVHQPSGMLLQEIWLSPTDNFVTVFSDTSLSEAQIPEECNKTQTRPEIPIGRPPMELPMEKLLELKGQALSARAIAKRLQEEGLNTSHMAVYRALKKAQQSKPRP